MDTDSGWCSKKPVELTSAPTPHPGGSTPALLGSTAAHPYGEGWKAMIMSQPHPFQDTLSPPSCLPTVEPLVLCFNIELQRTDDVQPGLLQDEL